MGMQLPGWAREMFLIMTGDGWPQADEDLLWALAQEWTGIATAVSGLETRITEPVRAIRRTHWDGPAADAFTAAGNSVLGHGGQQLTGLATGARELAEFIYNTGVNVQYMKIIVLEELVILAGQITYLIAIAPWTFGASTAAVPALQALGRWFAQSMLRQLIVSILAGQVLQIGLDAIDQLLQIAMGVRKRWDLALTANAAITGVAGAALGPLAHGVGALASKNLQHLAGKRIAHGIDALATNAVHEYTTSGVTGVVTGQGWTGSPWDLTAGGVDGATHLLGRHRHPNTPAPVPPLIELTGGKPGTTLRDGPASPPLMRVDAVRTGPTPARTMSVAPPQTGTVQVFDTGSPAGPSHTAVPTGGVDPTQPMTLPITVPPSGQVSFGSQRLYLPNQVDTAVNL